MEIPSIIVKILTRKPVLKAFLAMYDFAEVVIDHLFLWRAYILIKLLLLTLLGLLLAYITWHRAPSTSPYLLAAIVFCCSAGAVIAGYVQFYIEKSRVAKITLAAFKSPPLCHFLENGFDHRFHKQLWGKVNNYDIILTPAHGTIAEILTIRIPLKHPIDLDDIVMELTPHFSLVEESFHFWARTDIENYTSKHNYFELLNMITVATEKLQQRNMEPYHFAND